MRGTIIGRRALIGAALLVAAGGTATAQTTITVNGSGGTLAEAIKRVYETPFTQETGIRVRATAPVSLAKLKAMVQTGNMEWDVTELSGDFYPTVVKEGWVTKIDWSQIDPEKKLPDFARGEYGLMHSSFTEGLAVRTDKFKDGKFPTSWAEFWDVKAFPGPRSLRDTPRGNLEFALLADGVPKAELYAVLATDAGVDRAFKKLDQIKPHVLKWWKSGAEHVQLLSEGEVFATSAYNGRLAQMKSEQKLPVDIVWNGAALRSNYMVIPKGAKHVKEAHLYLKVTYMDPKKNAELVKVMPYPGFLPDIYSHLSPEVAKTLPTHPDNLSQTFRLSDDFWAANREKMQARWNTWILQ